MSKFSIQLYHLGLKNVWDDFVKHSKNATFLFQRDFMDYHKDRFQDYSLMVYKGNELKALLPAHVKDDKVFSHSGLSYGGLLLQNAAKFEEVLGSFKAILKFLNDNAIANLEIKLLPKIYHKIPSDGIDYLLFKTNAKLIRRDFSAVICSGSGMDLRTTNRKRNLKKALSEGVEVKEVENFKEFFNRILIPNLKERHEAFPTHSIEDIELLKSRFPNQIRQFNAYHNNDIIAGVTVFETQNVAHAQYISTINSKKEFGGLDVIFDVLIKTIYKHKPYFSFGISNEDEGQHVNLGLLKWKESFGARAISHDFYRVETKTYNLLDQVML